jgi:fatty acid desaturase
MGIDNDINLDPYLFLWIPKPGKDSHLRRYQHLYFVPMLFLLALNLRRQSFVITWTRRDPIEMAISCVAYSWLVFCMPWYVALGSVALCGFFVGMITTVPHQNEAIVMPDTNREYCFFTDQFLGTRGVDTPDVFNEYFWGGLQYQLEHHLFPTIPRYKYPALRPLIRQLAEKHNLEYKLSSVLEGWRLTLETMKQCSLPVHERSE